MRYTLWQRDVLVGETDFGLGARGGSRAGVFHPAPSGMAVLPALTAMAPALFELGQAMERLPLSDQEIERDVDGAVEALTNSPEGKKMLRAAEQIAELELRDPSGKRIPFESILLSDVYEMRGIGAELHMAKPHDRDAIRYVISATFSERKGSRRRAIRLH
jgi:hypothetical protein